MAEEEVLEDDHIELEAMLGQSYHEFALSPSRTRQRILNASRRRFA